ncbi:hypothetical protein [Sphingomonas qomolangmaensis]|uniref:Inner membrane protein n=1 Tax=Sphingomonas qomolangmaensis TaxID=2918765 RepID=A0ABY5L8B5_9SPHN|nr:hypothetical protein [Sphingomonas qomolangmaensis]UUL81990.1 hypothetical protein NMP03_12460 [Sphingomonas qomolangmaensis]
MNHDEVSFDAPPRRRSRVQLVALIGVLAFVAGIAATYWYVAPMLDRLGYRSGTAAPQPIVVQPQVVANQPAPPGTDLASLYAREITLAGRIQSLETRLANIDSDSRVASSFATRAEALLVAFAARRALDRGLPLGYLEGQLRQRFTPSEPRATNYVIEAARSPVTLEDLRLALDTLAPELVSGSDGANWWQNFRREMGGLVVLREDGTPSGRPTDRLIRARRMLDAGHVEGALAEIGRMPGATQASSWIEAARRYINARRALDIIEAAALQGVEPPAPALGVIPTPTPPPMVVPDATPAETT